MSIRNSLAALQQIFNLAVTIENVTSNTMLDSKADAKSWQEEKTHSPTPLLENSFNMSTFSSQLSRRPVAPRTREFLANLAGQICEKWRKIVADKLKQGIQVIQTSGGSLHNFQTTLYAILNHGENQIQVSILKALDLRIATFHKEASEPDSHSSDDDDDDDDTNKTRRAHNADAVEILEKAFQHTTNITQAEKHKLAQATGLQPRQVTIWFQNRRNRKSRRQQRFDQKRRKPIRSSSDNATPTSTTFGNPKGGIGLGLGVVKESDDAKRRKVSTSSTTSTSTSASDSSNEGILSASQLTTDSYMSSSSSLSASYSTSASSSSSSWWGPPETRIVPATCSSSLAGALVFTPKKFNSFSSSASSSSSYCSSSDLVFHPETSDPQLDLEDLDLDPTLLSCQLFRGFLTPESNLSSSQPPFAPKKPFSHPPPLPAPSTSFQEYPSVMTPTPTSRTLPSQPLSPPSNWSLVDQILTGSCDELFGLVNYPPPTIDQLQINPTTNHIEMEVEMDLDDYVDFHSLFPFPATAASS